MAIRIMMFKQAWDKYTPARFVHPSVPGCAPNQCKPEKQIGEKRSPTRGNEGIRILFEDAHPRS